MSDQFNITRQAGEDLDDAQYHAIALDDGKLATNGSEAGGIVINKPLSGEGANLVVVGYSRFAAGGAIAAGKAITATASGWFTAAGSGDYIHGRNGDTAVTSGSTGKGVFNFANPVYAFSSSYAW